MRSVEIIYRYEALDVPARPRPADPQAARVRLDDGNRAFAALLAGLSDDAESARRVVNVDPRDLGLLPEAPGAPRQRPFAAVLGCSDARVPIELIFNEGPNDLFVIRVAGNGLGNEVLASLKYAVQNLGGSLKLVVVLGHSGCGAAAAAVDVFLNPATYLSLATSHLLRNLLDRLLVLVQFSARALAQAHGADVANRPGYRAALIEAVVALNAALGAHIIERELGRDSMRSAWGVYLLETREVWAPRPGTRAWTGLADAPADAEDFRVLSESLTTAGRIASLVGG